MGFFDDYGRATKIQILNVENMSSTAMINYKASYPDGIVKTHRKNVKNLYSSYMYSTSPSIKKAECLGKVYIGLIKSDVRILFLVTLTDRTVDIIQEKQGTTGCNDMLAKCLDEEGSSSGPKPTPTYSTPEKKDEKLIEDLDIPIEILPNLYSLSLSNIALKHHITKDFNYVTLKCKVNFRLNGRKEGKRKIIFTSYDKSDAVVEIKGDYEKYHFTEAGYEFVDVCFDGYDKTPIHKITVSVREP